MKSYHRRLIALTALAGAALLATSCSQILDTIALAFSIVDIWV